MHSAPHCFRWEDTVLARQRLAAEQSIRRPVSYPDRQWLNGSMPLLFGSECVLSECSWRRSMLLLKCRRAWCQDDSRQLAIWWCVCILISLGIVMVLSPLYVLVRGLLLPWVSPSPSSSPRASRSKSRQARLEIPGASVLLVVEEASECWYMILQCAAQAVCQWAYMENLAQVSFGRGRRLLLAAWLSLF